MTNRTRIGLYTGLACSLLVTLAACEESASPLEASPPSKDEVTYHTYGYQRSIDEKAGEAVYEETCAGCHDGGVHRGPHKTMIQLMSAESIYKALTEGAMRMQAEGLNDDDKTRVAEYLADKRLGSGDALPSPTMCEVDSKDLDMSQPPAWPGWGLTKGNTRYISPAHTALNRDNVGTLQLKWAFAFPEALRVRSQPAIAGGAVIAGSHNGHVYALDQKTACVKWMFSATAEVRNGIVVSSWGAGDDTAQPMAFFGDLLGYVYAVDARTGELVWRDRPDMHPNATMTGAPTLHDGTLYVPISSLEVSSAPNPDYECCTFRGSVVAYDAATGTKKWQAYSVFEEPSPHGVTSAGTTRMAPSGAPIWNSPAIDEARGQILFGTGENYSSPATDTSDSIIAIDMETGKVNWVFQATAGDAWNSACVKGGMNVAGKAQESGPNCPVENGPDVDFGAGATLATTSDGRDLVIAGQKSGTVYALDPGTGDLIWQTAVGRGSLLGGINFGLASGNDKIYVPIADVQDGTGEDPSGFFKGARHPGLHALDMATGEILWRSPMEDTCDGREYCVPGIAVAITATDQLVFAGGIDGIMRIYDTETGAVLWQHQTAKDYTDVNGAKGNGGAISGGAGAVAYGDTLYVSSGYAFNGLMPGNVLLAFEIQP
jgi:polyvinyl alcohol dehydrogenase (cytochrome)